MKKSYNPFKMWGSWVGALVGLATVVSKIILYNAKFYWNTYANVGSFCYQTSTSIPCIKPFEYISIIIIGFLIGWAIHSVIRYLRRKRK
jgi:cell division protein FtsX